MAPRESEPQKETVERVMHEFKHGELRSGTRGQKVKNRKQAIAIALSEAGESNQQTPKENEEHLRHTKAKVAAKPRGTRPKARHRAAYDPPASGPKKRPCQAAHWRSAPCLERPGAAFKPEAPGEFLAVVTA
jgi:Family of unknown function (DUF6496)